MALPHPHGNSSGQIAHIAAYDTGVTPGSTGGKLIGFGEEGTSAIANRAAWALSENIDYTYQILGTEKAMPASFAFVGAGANFIQLAAGIGDIWVGDATYPGSAGTSDPEGMLMLFSVLDDQYNELEDGNGNEIRVKEVRENSNTTDIYQNGFETDPYIHFQSVNPITGAVVSSSYNIPGGTNVRIMCGEVGSLETMPADAFMRWKTHSMSEVQAGVFLQDGTRSMVGNFDAATNDIINAANVKGSAASPLTVEALSGVLSLIGGTDLVLKDQNLASAVPLSETNVTALYQPNTSYNESIVGSLNSQVGVNEAFAPNRILNRTGTVSANTTPDFDHPAIDAVLNGEQIRIAAGTVGVNDTTGVKYLYVDAADATPKTVDAAGLSAITSGSLLIYKGLWTTGAPGSWSAEVDLRWPVVTRGRSVIAYVGDGAGADFSDIIQAIEVVNSLLDASPLTGHAPEMVILGTAEASTQVDYGAQDWLVRGYGWGLSIIEPGAAFTTTTNDLITSTGKVVIKDVEVRWNDNVGADQADSAGALTLGPRSRIERVKFSQTGSYAFASCIRSDGANGIVVEDCYSDSAYTRAFWFSLAASRCRVSNCELKLRAGTDYMVYLGSNGADGSNRNTFSKLLVDSTTERPQTAVFSVWGYGNVLEDSDIAFTGGAAVPLVQMATLATTGPRRIGMKVKNCLLSGDTGYLYESTVADAAVMERSSFIDNEIASPTNDLFRCTIARASASRLKVAGNVVTGGPLTGKYLAYLNGGGQFIAKDNIFTGHTGKGIEVLADVTVVKLEDNWFDGWEDGDQLINVTATSTAKVDVRSNWFGATNVSTNADNRVITLSASGVTIEGNTFSGSVTDSHWALRMGAARNTVKNNQVLNYHRGYVEFLSGGSRNVVSGNQFEGGVDETVTVNTTTDVAANGIQFVAGANGNSISGNSFYDIDGRAISVNGAGNHILGNVFEDVVGKFLYDSTGEQMDRNSVISIVSGGTRTLISGNTIRGYGFAATTQTFEIRQCGVFDRGEYTNVQGNVVTNGIGSDLSATVDDYLYGFYKELGHGTYSGNVVYQDLSVSAPYKGYAAYRHANNTALNQVMWLGNFAQLTGTATGVMGGGAVGFSGSSGGTAVLIGNIVSGTWSSNGATEHSYNWACAGVAASNYAEQKDMVLSEANCMQIGNVQDGADALTLSGAPSTTAYNANTATPRADLNQSL